MGTGGEGAAVPQYHTRAAPGRVYQSNLKQNLGYPPTRTSESLNKRPVTVAFLNQKSSSISDHSDRYNISINKENL